METFEHFMEGITTIQSPSSYDQEEEYDDDNEPVAGNSRNSNHASSSAEMKGLKRRLKSLEEEVGALRSELRLIKRKLRDVDREPEHDKYRQLIQTAVAEALDSQRYWSIGSAVTGTPPREHNSKRKASDNSSMRTVKVKQRNYTNRLNFNEMTGDDSYEDEGDMDPLDVSAHLATVVRNNGDGLTSLKKSRSPSSRISFLVKREKDDLTRKPSKPGQSKRSADVADKQDVKVQRAVNSFGRKGRPTDLEYKKQVCRRAKKIGPTAAGREFNLPESTVRGWTRRLVENGIEFESPEIDDPDFESVVESYQKSEHVQVGVTRVSPNKSFAGTPSPKSTKRKYKQYESTPEVKMQACQRAREVGPTAAGRELNIPEGSIRHWLRFLPKLEPDSGSVEQETFEPMFGDNTLSPSPSSPGS